MSNLSHEFACGSGERGLNRVFTCGVYKCPALLHKWPHKQPVARLGLEQYSVQMGIISPQLTIRPPPAKLWPSSITSRVSLICLLGQLACAWQPDKDIIFRPDFRFHSAGSDIQVHSRYLSYYRDNICPIIAYNGTHIVSSFAPIVVEDSSWRIIALYSSQRIQPYNPTTIGVQLL